MEPTFSAGNYHSLSSYCLAVTLLLLSCGAFSTRGTSSSFHITAGGSEDAASSALQTFYLGLNVLSKTAVSTSMRGCWAAACVGEHTSI